MIKVFKPKTEFVSNVLLLMAGTTLAQAIPFAIAPILTRLYTPDEFGVFVLYLAVSGVLSVFATARYELAIMTPKNKKTAEELFWLSIYTSIVVSTVLFSIVLLFKPDICRIIGDPEIGNLLYLVPLSVFVTGLYQSLNYWNTRNKLFSNVAKTKVVQSTSIASTQIILGTLRYLCVGLIVGRIVGRVIATIYLGIKTKKTIKTFPPPARSVLKVAVKYKKFPLFSTWGAFFDTLGLQMPVFVLTTFFSKNATGQFGFVFRLLNLPMSLVGLAVSQVLFQKVAEMYNQNSVELRSYIVRLFFLLWIPMVPMIILFFLWGEPIFKVVFGNEWGVAGSIAPALSIAAAVRFVVSPLSVVLAMDHNLKLGALWQISYALTLTATLLWASQFQLETFVEIFAVHEVVLYLVYFAIILRGSKNINQPKMGGV